MSFPYIDHEFTRFMTRETKEKESTYESTQGLTYLPMPVISSLADKLLYKSHGIKFIYCMRKKFLILREKISKEEEREVTISYVRF